MTQGRVKWIWYSTYVPYDTDKKAPRYVDKMDSKQASPIHHPIFSSTDLVVPDDDLEIKSVETQNEKPPNKGW